MSGVKIVLGELDGDGGPAADPGGRVSTRQLHATIVPSSTALAVMATGVSGVVSILDGQLTCGGEGKAVTRTSQLALRRSTSVAVKRSRYSPRRSGVKTVISLLGGM